MGYARDRWQALEVDLRSQHLTVDVESVEHNDYGVSYRIVAPLVGPNRRVIRFRSIWQVDLGTDAPRLITIVPEKL